MNINLPPQHNKDIDFGNQYDYYIEEIDSQFPTPKIPQLDINIFCDSDHAHDKVTGRSVTGIMGFIIIIITQ